MTPSGPLDLASAFPALRAGGRIETLPHAGRTPRLKGFTVGIWETSAPAGHGGERHPDGDEFLYVLEGRIEIEVATDEGTRTIEVPAGLGCVLPQGVWHRVVPRGPCRLLHVTPGPAIEFKPPAATPRLE